MVSSRNADQSTHVDTPKTSSISVQLNFYMISMKVLVQAWVGTQRLIGSHVLS